MTDRRSGRITVDLATTLRQVRDPKIKVECKRCGRFGVHLRKKLVDKHGASLTFARLRRMSAMGCDRLISPQGDTCGTTFPCLLRSDPEG